MARNSSKKGRNVQKRYEFVPVGNVDGRREGKHHDLIGGILQELAGAPDGLAMKIPLSDVGGVNLANLRSAVHRGAAAKNLTVQTSSDRENLYVWKG